MIDNIGLRIREIRKEKEMSMQQLADIINTSKSLISQVERGEIYPSLQTIDKIAAALNVPISSFFHVDSKPRTNDENIVKAGKHLVIHMPSTDNTYQILTPPRHQGMEFLLIEYAPNQAEADIFMHGGQEYFYVLEGNVDLHIADEIYPLNNGDSGVFNSSQKHYFMNTGTKNAKVLIAATEPAM